MNRLSTYRKPTSFPKNKRGNDNLEQQAQALFRSWFVDFEPFGGVMPKEWEKKPIGELDVFITDFVANGSFASLKENVNLINNDGYAYFIRNVDLKSGSFSTYVDEHSYNFLAKSRLYGGEIIISNVGDVGSVFLCPTLDKPMTLGNNIIMLKSKSEDLIPYFFILFKSPLGQGLLDGITGGSAQPKFNKTDFKSLKVVIPNGDTLLSFHEIVNPMLTMINKNNMGITRLSSLRDTLLPKLMSGELKVNEINA